jgi:alcohol/geraniol dehydrogenase (NADP+)
MKIHAYAARGAQERLVPYEYEAHELGPLDVGIEITHCGICHSDLLLIDNDFGVSSYPAIPGHEIVGRVVAKGSLVTGLALGQRVGVGPQASGCFQCEACLSGQEQLCPQSGYSFGTHSGGFADHIQVDSRFAFPLPDALPSAEAAPLFCGGVTVFSPLWRYGVNAHTRLGVVSIGGLGHIALQFAWALGCPTTAFSTSPAKAEDARRLGATSFVHLHDEQQMAAQANSLDLILTTASTDLPWFSLINALRPNGVLCLLGAPASEIHFPILPFVWQQKQVVGSWIGSRAIMHKMLDFAARHQIHPQIECFPMGEVNAALDHLRAGKAHYRVVLTRE